MAVTMAVAVAVVAGMRDGMGVAIFWPKVATCGFLVPGC